MWAGAFVLHFRRKAEQMVKAGTPVPGTKGRAVFC